MTKRTLSLLLSLLMLLTAFPFAALAESDELPPEEAAEELLPEEALPKEEVLPEEDILTQTMEEEPSWSEEVTSGTYGDNLTWSLDRQTGTMTISGTGPMINESMKPWNLLKKAILSLVVEEGVTTLGQSAFYGCTHLSRVSLPSTLTSIGEHAFDDCKAISSLVIPQGVTHIGGYAFEHCSGLQLLSLPESLTEVGTWAFPTTCAKLQWVYYAGSQEQREQIQLGTGNSALSDALWQYAATPGQLPELFVMLSSLDEGFQQFIRDHYATSRNETIGYYMTKEQAAAVTTLDMSDCYGDYTIASLAGIDSFFNLTYLWADTNAMERLILQGLPKLETVILVNTRAPFDCAQTAYDPSWRQTYESTVVAEGTGLDDLDIELSNLRHLSCPMQRLSHLDLSYCPALETLDVRCNQFYSLCYANCPALQELQVDVNRMVGGIAASAHPQLRLISFRDNLLSGKGNALANHPALEELYLDGNRMDVADGLDVSGCARLRVLSAAHSQLPAVNLQGDVSLAYVNLDDNGLCSLTLGEELSAAEFHMAGQNSYAHTLVSDEQGFRANLGALVEDAGRVRVTTPGAVLNADTLFVSFPDQVESFAYVYTTGRGDMDVTVYFSQVFTLQPNYFAIDENNFPDPGLLAGILENTKKSSYRKGDADAGYYMEPYGLSSQRTMDLAGYGIRDLTGLEAFFSLTTLNLGVRQSESGEVLKNYLTNIDLTPFRKLTSLDITGNPIGSLESLPGFSSIRGQLRELSVSGCELDTLNTSQMKNLVSLDCSYNPLGTLNVTKNTDLQSLDCSGLGLSTLNLKGNRKLVVLYCADNNLSDLALSSCKNLALVDCRNNQLTGLKVGSLTYLQYLLCDGNRLTSLDVTGKAYLHTLTLSDNQLKTLKLKRVTRLNTLDIGYNQIAAIDLSPCESLRRLSIAGNSFSALPAIKNPNIITYLDVSETDISSLDLVHFGALQTLRCSYAPLSALDVSRCKALHVLDCTACGLTGLNLSNNKELTALICPLNALGSLDLSRNTRLETVYAPGQIVRHYELIETQDGFVLDLSALVADTQKVILSGEGVSYDPLTGLAAFTEEVEAFAYAYDTGLDGVYMTVAVLCKGVPPLITAQPQSQGPVAAKTRVTFTVAAEEAEAYQWQFSDDGGLSWQPIPGARESSYTLTAAKTMNGQQYRCQISNQDGTVESDPATLSVKLDLPVITVQPQVIRVQAGKKGTFTVKAANAKRYQWQLSKDNGDSWQDIPKAASAKLTLPATDEWDAWLYRCRIGNADGEVFSQTVQMDVYLVYPTVTLQPKDARIRNGKAVSFSVKGKDAKAYQWQQSADGSTWQDIPGATKNKLALKKVTFDMDGNQYRCVLTNADGSVPSSAATLTVYLVPPVVTAEPKAVTVKAGKNAAFTVKAKEAKTYQWEVSADGETWAEVPQAAKAKLALQKVTADLSGNLYRCHITGPDGDAYSNPAALTVNP